ncbi:MAG TPA: alpha/beta hydrolase [Chitinispirillaceae bacterium]|nr:alpha/beta hydrolase [Chitinispirillaceae bacterium]
MSSKCTLIFGGWSLSPALLKDCFGPGCILIDCNSIMPALFDDNYHLYSNWPQQLKQQLHLPDSTRYHLAGWSAGAMLAIALSSIVPIYMLTLISPTLSFCRRANFRYGTHPSVLRTMREQLLKEPGNVLTKFYRSCGFGEAFKPVSTCTTEQLTMGLHFLEQADLVQNGCTCSNTIIIHGRNDAIIPYPSAEMTASVCGGTLYSIDAGHAVFYGREKEIANYIQIHTTEGNFS